MLAGDGIEFKAEAARVYSRYDAIKTDLALRHEKMHTSRITFRPASISFQEEAGEAEIADARNVSEMVALPIHPNVPCGREAHRSSPARNR